MGIFSKKDPAEDYAKNKKAYLDKMSVSRNKNVLFFLNPYKFLQVDRIARIYVRVMAGCVKTGDLLEIMFERDNKLGITNTVGQVKAIYQVHGTGRQEELVAVDEAYEQDMVWIDVPEVSISLVDKKDSIRQARSSGAESISSDPEISISSDPEISKMVNYFKVELNNYFALNQPIGHITQDLSHSLLMQKKRLDKLGILMTTVKSDDAGVAAINMDVKRYSSSQYDVGEADEAIRLSRTYSRGGQIVYRDENWQLCHYLLAGSKFSNDGMISCPSCGNYAPREELLNGCPYCNTQFTIQDLSLRVAGYSQKKIEPKNGRIDVGFELYHAGNQKELDQVMQHRMKEVDPLFSATAFYNSMRNKLYSVVFAENVASLQSLADEDFDVTPYFDRFENVIDIDIQNIETRNFKKNDQYILTDVVMTVMVLRFSVTEVTAEWTKEMITMSFVKHINNKTKNIFEPAKVQCEKCGGSYSLYDGKACSFCGSEIDYLMYDWLLIDMAIQ